MKSREATISVIRSRQTDNGKLQAVKPRSQQMEFVWIYTTTKDKEEAKKIAADIIDQRLVACANIIDNMTSMYWWQGKVENEEETVLIMKSRRDLISKIIDRVKKMHSYTCPCIIALPIQEGNPDFLDWIKNETKDAGE